ncbi:MAG: hypothetical protein K2J58_00125, partial [Muribaculaceae bacterium]|nr:hypothetical protein [Muribaculaceae bacterium]
MPKSMPGTVKNSKFSILNSQFSIILTIFALAMRKHCRSGKIWLLATTEKNAKTAHRPLAVRSADMLAVPQ